MRHLPKFIDTFCEVGSDEIDVRCEFDYQPDEPDTNTGESITVTAAYRYTNGKFDNVLARMTPDESLQLSDRVMDSVRGRLDQDY